MTTTILINGIECKLITELDKSTLLAYADFVNTLTKWEEGEVDEFPYEAYAEPDPDAELSLSEGELK